MRHFNNEHVLTCVVCLGAWLLLILVLHGWAAG